MTQPAEPGLRPATRDALAARTAGAASRRRIAARTRLDFWFDAVLLVAYTLAYSIGFTGLAVHEWLGIGLGLALLLHLTLHWDWVLRAAEQVIARQIAARQAAAGRKDGFSLGHTRSLERTIMVEAVLTTIVVAASSTRRRRRQARRRTLSSASP